MSSLLRRDVGRAAWMATIGFGLAVCPVLASCAMGKSLDGGVAAETVTDAAPRDASLTDAGRSDASTDAGRSDGSTDAGRSDASTDAGRSDASTDAGAADASTDAGPRDASTPDAGAADASVSLDAGTSVAWPLPGTPRHPYAYSVSATVAVDDVTKLVWQRSVDRTTRTQTDAIAYCDALVLGGRDDFRTPSRLELASLVDFARTDPAIDPAFPSTPRAQSWTSTAYRFQDAQLGYVVDFTTGVTNHDSRRTPHYVRCVSGPPAPTPERFVDAGNGTVRDPATGLSWQQMATSRSTYDAASAAAYCASLVLDGTGWRLPEILELESIVDETAPGLAPEFPSATLACPSYWSATEDASDPTRRSWFLADTSDIATARNSNLACVRCTR